MRNVHFVGGCDGNLKAVSKLVDGMSVAQIEALLRATPGGAEHLLRRPAGGGGTAGL